MASKILEKVALRKKIQGFGAKDIEQAKTYNDHLERTERLAELEHQARLKRLEELGEKQEQLVYHNRKESSSSDSSNYDTPPGSPTPSTAKPKGKLKRKIDQIANAFSFSFRDSKLFLIHMTFSTIFQIKVLKLKILLQV